VNISNAIFGGRDKTFHKEANRIQTSTSQKLLKILLFKQENSSSL